MKIIKNILLTVFLLSVSFAQDITNGCDLPDMNLYLSDNNEVWFNSSSSIGGYQFNVDGATVNSATGGESSSAGFIINASANLVLAFSMTAGTIPAGCGTLVNLDVIGNPTGLSSIIVSDAIASPLPFEYFVPATLGCMDDTSCNYNEDATEDDGSCLYLDCSGECGGLAQNDECGICGGDNSSCTGCMDQNACNYDVNVTININSACIYAEINYDCDGNCIAVGENLDLNGLDCTGECGGDATELDCQTDCFGIFQGAAKRDECGTCIDCFGEFENDCIQHPAWNASCTDCNEDVNGNAYIDACGVCVAGNTDEAACLEDCDGSGIGMWTIPGPFHIDNCGVCDNNPSNDCIVDCFGEWGGTAYIDNCGHCVGGTTGDFACVADCLGEWGGLAVEDECGICGGDNSTCVDCAGIPNGNAIDLGCGCGEPGPSGCDNTCGSELVEDECGICGGDGSSCNTSTDLDCDPELEGDQKYDCAGNCNGIWSLDACGVCGAGNTIDYSIAWDCNNECFGNTILDECGVCGGDSSSCSWTDLSVSVENINNIKLSWDEIETYLSRSSNECESDICISIDNISFTQGILDIYIINNVEIGGFQFNLPGVVIDDASGGTASANGFTISISETTVLAFSLTGSIIPIGEGVLVQISFSDFEGESICFGTENTCGDANNKNLFSSPSGTCVESVLWGDCYCAVEVDECGVCGGSGIPEGDCDCNGNKFDECGECIDCTTNSVWQSDCTYNSDWNATCADCNGIPYGDGLVDNCGTCDNDPLNDCLLDCSGLWGGNAIFDECGNCTGGTTNMEYNYALTKECWDGDWNGPDGYPDTGDELICETVGETFPLSLGECPINPDALSYKIYRNGLGIPIAAVQGETEYIDVGLDYDSQFCYTITYVDGGVESAHSYQVCTITESMPIIEGCMSTYACNYDISATLDNGSCWFADSGCSCEDGEGAMLDNCGTCDVDSSNDCTPDCNGVWGGDAQLDMCNVCDNNSFNDCTLDCNNIWGGSAKLDMCNVCDDDSDNDCVEDCNGVWGGDAVIDECDVCDGDNECLSILDSFVPKDFSIQNIYPNPFNPITNIDFGLPESGIVEISVYNVHGRKIESLIKSFQLAGNYSITWDASDYSSGVYLINMESVNNYQVKQVVLMK